MTSSAICPDGPIVVLCGAEGLLQIVLGQESTVLHAEAIHCPGGSVTVLAPALARILAAHGLRAQDLGGAAAVRGPGSFTGLRITLATLAGLGLGAGIPLAGLDLHPVLAAQVPQAPRLWVATHARTGLVYAQAFAGGQPTVELAVLRHAELHQRLAEAPALALGSGLRAMNLPAGTTLLPPAFDTPWPATLLAAARAARFEAAPPAPLYLRRSDAEDNLPAIAAARGLTEAQARQHIPDFVALPPWP